MGCHWGAVRVSLIVDRWVLSLELLDCTWIDVGAREERRVHTGFNIAFQVTAVLEQRINIRAVDMRRQSCAQRVSLLICVYQAEPQELRGHAHESLLGVYALGFEHPPPIIIQV